MTDDVTAGSQLDEPARFGTIIAGRSHTARRFPRQSFSRYELIITPDVGRARFPARAERVTTAMEFATKPPQSG
jgi:hypothetical protein